MTGGDAPSDLEARVAALEKAVASLEGRLAAAPAPPRPEHDASPARRTPSAPIDLPLPPPRTRATIAYGSSDPGQWVNRLGIALLLLGAAFGFKYSIDRGWMGPAFRVCFGLALAALLLLLSSLLRERRPGLSRVLAGGGIASGYLSVYAAFHLYDLLSGGTASLAMSAVTAVAFLVSVGSDDALAATIGTIGGLATPFVLYGSREGLRGLVAYTCVVVAAAAAVFVRKGWRSLMTTVTVGGWTVLAAIASDLAGSARGDALVVEAGAVFVALATWWLAVVRETWAAEDPATWKPAGDGFGANFGPRIFGRLSDEAEQSHMLTLLTPIALLFVSRSIWDMGESEAGWTALTLAAGWSVAALQLRRIAGGAERGLAATHAVAAAVMLAFAMSLLLGDDARRLGLAAEGLALLVLASRSAQSKAATLAHVLFAIVGTQTLRGMLDVPGPRLSGIDGGDVADLGVVAALAAAVSVQDSDARVAYLVAAQAGLLLWFRDVLGPLRNGAALVTAAWFTSAVALLVAGLRRDSASLRVAGGVTMAITMAKLFVLDLATVGAGLRIVIFLGFGAVLLALGYAFPALWRRDDD